MAMTEPQIQKNIKDSAEQLGFVYYHTRNSFGSDKGFPDIVVSGPIDSPAPSTFFYETKGPKGVVAPEQLMWLGLLNASGHTARLVREADLYTVYADLETAYHKHLEAVRRERG